MLYFKLHGVQPPNKVKGCKKMRGKTFRIPVGTEFKTEDGKTYGITPNALDVKFLGRFSDWESADSFFQSSKAKKS